MQTHERQNVLDHLASSEARLLELTEGLTVEQWGFRETPERWSIAENIEHVIVVESRIMRAMKKMLEGPGDPAKGALVAGKDSILQSGVIDRRTKLNAPEGVRPVGKWTDTAELLAELRNTRAQTVAFVADTQAELRNHVFPHIAFGDLDCYQWLIVLSRHGARHAQQIEEIKANPAWPVGTAAAKA